MTILAFLCAAAVTSCELIDIEVIDEVGLDVEGQLDPPPPAGDSFAVALEPPPPQAMRPVSPTTTPLSSAHAVATPLELAALRAVLDVPVPGVARTALRDSYTEARGDRSHEALDILAPRGTPIVSATDGRLLKIFNSQPGGLMVYATDASERFILLYGHLDRYADGLSEGMPLARGQLIGYVGTTGNAQVGTPHLHFGILRGDPGVSWWTGIAVNPYPLLAAVETGP